MADFSASQAIGAGFGVIRRHPVAVLVWTLAYLVIGVLPQLAVVWAMLPDLMASYQEIGRRAAEHGRPDMAGAMALQSRMMALQPISFLASIVSQTVLLGAIYRAVLTPEDRRFFYLRLGVRELWMGLTVLVLVVLWIIMIFCLAVPLAIGGGIAAAMAHGRDGGGLAVMFVLLLGLAGLGVIVWVMLRLSMAPPMSFARKSFTLYESWSLTAGHALKLFGVALALFVILMVLEALIFGALGGIVFGGLLTREGWRALIDATPQSIIHTLLPGLAVFLPLAALVGTALYVVMLAPFADIYRQLTGGAVEG